MALTSCPDCGTDVSSSATECPKCGRKLGTARRTVFGLLAAFVVLTLLFGCAPLQELFHHWLDR